MSVISGTVGAIMGSNASEDAANAQADASKYAAQVNKEIFEMQRADLKPFVDSAKKMLPYTEEAMRRADRLGEEYEWSTLQYEDMFRAGPGQFEESDYYKDMVSSVDYAINKAAKEMQVRSTATGSGYGRDLMNYAVPMASEMYKTGRGNFVNEWMATQLNPMQTRMAQLGGTSLPANSGMNVIPSLTSAGNAYATNAGNAMIAGGNAQAAGILGSNMAIQQGLGGVSNAAGIGLGLLTGRSGAGAAGTTPLSNDFSWLGYV